MSWNGRTGTTTGGQHGYGQGHLRLRLRDGALVVLTVVAVLLVCDSAQVLEFHRDVSELMLAYVLQGVGCQNVAPHRRAGRCMRR